MQIIESKKELVLAINSLKESKASIGFVPTMGALHLGHLSLVETALKVSDYVVVSIFVNPTQFENLEDLDKYPKTRETDLRLIKELSQDKRILVYFPSYEDIYPDKHMNVDFDFGSIAQEMEGINRPGHFKGVGNVLKVLFHQVQPDKAFFGEKDYQQLLIVKKLCEILNLPIEIIGCPIIRESNGLAMSSRNTRLNENCRNAASIIFQSLIQTRAAFAEKSIKDLEQNAIKTLKKVPDLKVEYFTIRCEESLSFLSEKRSDLTYRAFVVAHLCGVRLIDNMQLN